MDNQNQRGRSPGTLLGSEPVDTSIPGARAWRITYVSRDVNDVDHQVTGLVIAPTSPGADRPVMTWCHGTTGLGDAACPSRQEDPARELALYFSPDSTAQIDYGIPGLQGFIDDGWVVCSTDYQGLGSPGLHQYNVNRSNARDAVYIAWAARQLGVGAGTALACVGWSQGGAAAAAVAELDATDYGEMTLVGIAALSPSVSRIGLESPLGPSAALHDPAAPPDARLIMFFAGQQAASPATLALGDVFTPLGVEILAAAWNIQPVHHLTDTIGRVARLKGPVLKAKPDNFETWKSAIVAGSAANRKPSAPVLVCIDSFDGGIVTPVPWQNAYVDVVKGFGGSVEVREYPDDDHFSLPQSCIDGVREWLTKLLD